MALGKLQPKNGAITVAGVGGDFASFDLEARQIVDNTTGYTETTDCDHMGSGCREWTLDFSGFCTKDAASTKLGLGALTDTAAAVVCTLDTGCTYTGSFVLESLRVSHKKLAGAVPFQGRGYNKGAIVEAWDES